MDQEFRDDGRRGKIVIVLGVILAVVAGGAAFFLVNQAQQQAGQAQAQKVPAVVAIQVIPAREVIEAADVEVRQVPLDPTNANGVIADPAQVIGRLPAVSILQGQLITTNMLASSDEGGQFSILGPDEAVTEDSPAWRAVSLTVSDDLAVGGLLKANKSATACLGVSPREARNTPRLPHIIDPTHRCAAGRRNRPKPRTSDH